jgi:hypothetical protein
MSSFTIWDQIYPWLVAGIGGFVGAALILPTKLGEALFSYRLGKALEGFKAERALELEQLREQLSHLGDRGRRSNELEFTSIELVWRAFVKAWLSTNTCIGSMTQIPRFASMADEDVKSFASASGMSENDQKLLLAANDREKVYLNIVSWQRVIEAGQDVYQTRLKLREQRIFMPEEITKEFGDVIERMSGAQVERRLSLENPQIQSYEFGKASTDWLQDCVPTFEKLAKVANERLFRKERE